MDIPEVVNCSWALGPPLIMAALAGLASLHQISTRRLWSLFQANSLTLLAFISLSLTFGIKSADWPGVITASSLGLILALLVQLLGTVICAFSARYLVGEVGQHRFVGALAAVLASVHLLLIADHWLLLIAAWTSVGMALQHLLCFYPERSFAQLAAHKKFIADRVADVMLLVATALAWIEVGSGSLSALKTYVAHHGMPLTLQMTAVLLVLAVIVRTALLPVHGWLIQVMEAPTPISALLHAGVVNLGGFVIIQTAPIFEPATAARIVLWVFGLTTAVLAGMVMLTRVTIKVRLAWSTVAQMGFMLVECALGLYTLAALHLIGHSLYKANAFLRASSSVRHTRMQLLRGASRPNTVTLLLAPGLSTLAVFLVQTLTGQPSWPWWWSLVLGLGWAPLIWLPSAQVGWPARMGQVFFGFLMVLVLSLAAVAAHALPFGLHDAPDHELGLFTLIVMASLYAFLTLLQMRPLLLARLRRCSYAGFYLDEKYTRLTLYLWPVCWRHKPTAQV